MNISTVGELREFLSKYPDDAPLVAQTVGSVSGAWTMFLAVHDGKECSFKWDINPVIVQMKHPSVKHLDMSGTDEEDS